MLRFKDNTDAVDEKRTERMHFRAKPQVKSTIERAAAISGVDGAAFTMSAAYERALATIAAHETTMLAETDHQIFLDALDKPKEPTKALQQAFKTHGERLSRS